MNLLPESGSVRMRIGTKLTPVALLSALASCMKVNKKLSQNQLALDTRASLTKAHGFPPSRE